MNTISMNVGCLEIQVSFANVRFPLILSVNSKTEGQVYYIDEVTL